MAKRSKRPSDDELRRLYQKHDGVISHVARDLGMARTTVDDWYKTLDTERPAPPKIELPEFAEPDIEVDDIIDTMCKRFERRQTNHKQKQWFPIKVNHKKAIGLAMIGDPHVDDDGCNWPLLKHHCELLDKTEGLYAVNIGDSENAWAGRLQKLYAEQETSRTTAHRLSEWFLNDSGIDWICWLMGNHDLWTELPEIFRAKNVKRIPMEDWQARFRLVFPNGRECRIWAAHNFKGHSQWNSVHGMQKAAHMKDFAHIYAAGHTHNWACHQEEHGHSNEVYWLVRSRGYKFIDQYAEILGHFPQQEGASITCIIDPNAKSAAGFVTAFADMDLAVDYLNFLRR